MELLPQLPAVEALPPVVSTGSCRCETALLWTKLTECHPVIVEESQKSSKSLETAKCPSYVYATTTMTQKLSHCVITALTCASQNQRCVFQLFVSHETESFSFACYRRFKRVHASLPSPASKGSKLNRRPPWTRCWKLAKEICVTLSICCKRFRCAPKRFLGMMWDQPVKLEEKTPAACRAAYLILWETGSSAAANTHQQVTAIGPTCSSPITGLCP